MKRIAAIAVLLTIIVVSSWSTMRSLAAVEKNHAVDRPNILIVSVCSMRRDMVKYYGGTGEMPVLDRFFDTSTFYFANAFNPIGWTSISSYIDPPVSGDVLRSLDYVGFGTNGDLFYRVPQRRQFYPSNNVFEKAYAEDMHKVETWIRHPWKKPFVAQIHVKYMHYPLIDRYNSDSQWDLYLDQEEREYVGAVAKNPEKYWRQLPFVLLLTNDHRVFANHPEIRAKKIDVKNFGALEGLMTNPEMIKVWKQQPDYPRDLQIIKKIYRANAHHMDKILDPLLNLWGDKKLQENTIVMFMSDHGETHMERDLLTHGSSIFDEALAIAGAVKIPGQVSDGNPERLEEQYDFRTIGQWVEKLVITPSTADEGADWFKNAERKPFITRDCNFQRRGMRIDNAYKYIVDNATDERFLFDLKADPGELNNIAETSPQLLQKFEAQFWELYPSFTSVPVNNCKLWPVE